MFTFSGTTLKSAQDSIDDVCHRLRKQGVSSTRRKPTKDKIILEKLSSLPNFGKFVEQRNLWDEVQKLWWSDPSKHITVDSIMEKFQDDHRSYLVNDKEHVRQVFELLVEQGFINKTLFNPRRTKMEYFWLFVGHFVLNIFALMVEFLNGGVKTVSGLYISWDVRLLSFFIGLIFLALYYRKYHVLKSLIRVQFCGCGWRNLPIFCCCKKDVPMQAIPDDIEMQRFLSDEDITNNEPTKKSRAGVPIQTQTSIQEPAKIAKLNGIK